MDVKGVSENTDGTEEEENILGGQFSKGAFLGEEVRFEGI